MEEGRRQYDFEVTGPVSHLTGKVVVHVPAGYSDPAQAGRRYPVTETFHGYPGTPEQWLDAMDLGTAVDTEADPARYGAAVVFGGYFAPQFSRTYQPFGTHLPARYDLVNAIRGAPPPVAMWIETSHSDKLSYSTTAAFLRAARAPMSVRAVEYTHAAHSIPLWAGLVPDAVQWLASQVPGFRAGA
jgi:hypothetical protein